MMDEQTDSNEILLKQILKTALKLK